MLSMPDTRSRASIYESQQRQSSQFASTEANMFNSKPQQDTISPASAMLNGFGGPSMWSSGSFGQKLAAKQLDAIQTKALNPRAQSQTFEPRTGSASLINSSEAEIPWSRRGSAWNIDLKAAKAQPGSTLVSPSPLSFGQLASQPAQSSYSAAVKHSLVAGSRTQSLARIDQVNEYASPTTATGSPFSNYKGLFEDSKPQSFEPSDFPWGGTRSTSSPIQDARDAFSQASGSSSRKSSMPVSRHAFEPLAAASQDPFARRGSRPEIQSSAATLRMPKMSSAVREDNRPQMPAFSSQQSTSAFRRPSSHASSLWSADAFNSRDLFGKRSSTAGYASSPSNCSPTNDMGFAQQDAQLNNNNNSINYGDESRERQNSYAPAAPAATQPTGLTANIQDPWQVSASPYMSMNNSRHGSTSMADHFQQQMYLNMQYQLMAAQGRAGQFMPPMGPFGYYPMNAAMPPPPAFYPQMAAPAPASAPVYQPAATKPAQSHAKTAQSSKLHEFHANNSRGRRYELKDIFGHVVEFSGDQQGSRFLQTKLETANSDEKSTLFAEIMPNARQLMQDIYGNYVVQKLFEHGDQNQKKLLANTLKGHIPALSMQPYGCRVVQKAFDHILTDQQAELVAELNADNRVIKCLRDQHGNHVIQKAIEVIPSPYIQFIYEAMQGQILQFSIHTFGCRVVQRMLEKQDEVLKASVLEELSKCSPDLVMDSFGNYVAQHVIKHGDDVNRARMITLVLNNVKTFARHKFASNVVEKCILHGTLDQQLQILNHVLDPAGDGLAEYIKCAYGNYVIQSLLENLPQHHGQQLYHQLIPEVHKAKRTTPKKTIEGIEEKMARFDTPHSSRPSSMASAGEASTPASITSSVTSVGPFVSDMLDTKTQSTTCNNLATIPIEQSFGNLSITAPAMVSV